jgi:DNA-binding NtrC family response regulator
LLLTDFGLSGNPSGPDLAERLRKAKPHLKVAYTSEFSTDTETPEPAPPEGLELVVKPFSPDRLIDAVQAFLARPG